MASAITDLIDRVSDSTTGRPVISALASPGKAIGAVSLSITDATNWTTSSAIHFSIYQVTAQGYKDPTTQTDWKGTLSGTTITNLTLTGGTDRAYNTGDKVEITPTSRYAKDLYDWGITHANTDGTLKTSAVQQALNISTSSTDWTPLANTPTLVSSNGQREHLIRYTGVDYTDRLQAGAKLRIPRTSTVPTQSAQFVAASSQYASKASPAGISFTNNFTCEAWVYIDSYAGTAVISRIGANQGWQLEISTLGQVAIHGYSGAYANERNVRSYQSIPLNKWVHIAGTLDMSGWTTATNKIYIDAVDVPVQLISLGTNPTALVQEGNLEIGAFNGANSPFNGKVANARLWSTIRTAAQIRDNANKQLVGNETGLVGYWPLNGTWNDLTANANNLTTTGGAIATYADNPFKATEYAIVTNVSFTGGNTDVTIFSGSNAIPNETLGATSFSGMRAPYGFPVNKEKWAIYAHNLADLTYTIGSAATTYFAFPGLSVQAPVGEWILSEQVSLIYGGSTAGTIVGKSTMSTEAVAPSAAFTTNALFIGQFGARWGGAPNATELDISFSLAAPVSVSSQTNYKFGVRTETAAGTYTVRHAGVAAECRSYLKLECAYL